MASESKETSKADDEANPSVPSRVRRKKEKRRDSNDERKDERPTDNSSMSHFIQFRRNLDLIEEARLNRQFDLAEGDLEADDIDTNHVLHQGDRLRADWGDGTGGDLGEILRPDDANLADDYTQLPGGPGEGGAAPSGREGARREARRKRQRYYAETASGDFRPWQRDAIAPRLRRRPISRGSGEAAAHAYAQETFEESLRDLEPYSRGTFLWAQGLFSGFAAGPGLLQWCSTTDADFILIYRGMAGPIRRLLLLLCALSLLGSIDAFSCAFRPPVLVVKKLSYF